METTTYQSWIDKGYESFALSGSQGITVQKLARTMGTSKSSFYHHFGDQQTFIETLLDEHQDRTETFGSEARQCKTLVPDFVELIIKYKSVILFQRNLRRQRKNLDFQLAYLRAEDVVAREILDVWANYMVVQSDISVAKSLYIVTRDVFYERVSDELFTPEWITRLIDEIKGIVQKLVARRRSPVHQ